MAFFATGSAASERARPAGAVTASADERAGMLPTPHAEFWPTIAETAVAPEPTEQARYLILLTAPLLLAAFALALVRDAPRWLVARASAGAALVEYAAVALIVVCFAVQWTVIAQDSSEPEPYFEVASLVVAGALAAAIVAGVRRPSVRAGWTRLTRESRTRRAAAALLALAAVIVTVLPVINTDGSIAAAPSQVSFHLQFIYDEAMAVLDGRSPLHDFATQYTTLLPYLLAACMSLFGTSVGCSRSCSRCLRSRPC